MRCQHKTFKTTYYIMIYYEFPVLTIEYDIKHKTFSLEIFNHIRTIQYVDSLKYYLGIN